MNYSSKSKNIFINILLIIALVTSVIGGAMLMIPEHNKWALASEVINGKPTDVKFVSQIVTANATSYDPSAQSSSNPGFQYASADKYNYANIKDIVYYVYNNKLYVDAAHNIESSDLSYTVEGENSVVAKKITTDGNGSTYSIYSDRYSIEYNGLRYFLKDESLYTDIACTKMANLSYTLDPQNDRILINDTYAVTITNENVNKFVTLHGTKYYLYDGKLFEDKPFNVSDNYSKLIGTNQGDEYASGFIFLKMGSCDVLYKVSEETQDGSLNGIKTTLTKVVNLATEGTTYYINSDNYDGLIYSYNNISEEFEAVTNLSFTYKTLITRDGNKFLVASFTYSYDAISTEFYLTTELTTEFGAETLNNTYYIINNYFCERNSETSINATINIDGKSFYSFEGVQKSLFIDKNNVIALDIDGVLYYPFELFGNKYYVTESNNEVYRIKSNGNSYVPEKTIPLNCINAEVNFSNNLAIINITYDTLYSISSNQIYEAEPISLINRNSFICYSDTYFYNNNALYLQPNNTIHQVKDFNYICNLTHALHDGIYHTIEEVDFNYVVIDGKTFYLDENNELYSNIEFGGENVVNFLSKYHVSNESFSYKLNTDQHLVTLFDSTQTTTIMTDDTFDGYFSGYVIIDNKKYYVDKNDNTLKYVYKSNSGFSVDYSENKPTKLTIWDINSTEFILRSLAGTTHLYYLYNEGNRKQLDNKECFYCYDTENTGKNGLYFVVDFYKINFDFKVEFNQDRKQITYHNYEYGADVTATLEASNYGYYTVNLFGEPYFWSNDKLYLAPIPAGSDTYTESEDCAVLGSNIKDNDITYNAGNGDYLWVDSDTLYYQFSDTSEYNPAGTTSKCRRYTTASPSVKIGELTYTINGTQLLVNGVEPSFMFMDYEYDATTGILSVIKYDSNQNKFLEYSSYYETDTIRYIENIADNKFEILAKDLTTLGLYDKVTIDANHTYTPENPINSNFISNNVYIAYHPLSSYFDIQTESGQNYRIPGQEVKEEDNNTSGYILLNNYTQKDNFLTKGSTSEIVDTYYIGINEKYYDGENTPIRDSGIHQLQVQAYLNNDYVAKYRNSSSSYYTDPSGKVYGILLKINNIKEENVKYNNLDNVNVNHYWYQYIDLTQVYALVRYTSDDSKFVEEYIPEASGVYTFIFQFTYINNGKSTQYVYTYSIHITENSYYVDYPTFNTQLTTLDAVIPTPQQYTVVVEEKVDTDRVGGNYFYNNENYDIPIYLYDASKYNVSYTYKYNISQNTYTTEFVLNNTGVVGGEYGSLRIYKDGTLKDTYIINTSTKTFGGSDYIIIDYNKNGTYYGALCITQTGDYLLSIEDFYYYNDKNIDDYADKGEYYKHGRLIRNGATNTPLSYYMCLPFEDLGDYVITNKYLIPDGISSNGTTSGTFTALPETTKNIFYGSHNVGNEDNPFILRNSEIMNYGYYQNGNFRFNTGLNYEDLKNTHEEFPNTPSSITLKYYGIETKFIKDGKKIQFRKIDDNIYSDISPAVEEIGVEPKSIQWNIKSSYPSNIPGQRETSNNTNLTSLIGESFTPNNLMIQFDANNNIPLTNLQPIYFDYFGNFDYSNSKYYRFENCIYDVDDSTGLLRSIEFKSGVVTRTEINFTNKTSISAPGFYIVKVTYGPDSYCDDVQYFAFVINNSAPNLKIYTVDENNYENLFISSTQFSTTTRYTNDPIIKAKWSVPNYFQGNISLSYTRTSYDGNTLLQNVENYTNASEIRTSEGKYTFTIKYGIGGASFSTTYIIVDKTTPTGQMFSVDKYDTIYRTNLNNNINNVFSTNAVFASTPIEEISLGGSGAKVSARIAIISFGNYDNSGATDINKKIIPDSSKTFIEAIRTNVELDASNSLFSGMSELDKSPKYNFLNIADINDNPAPNNQTEVSPTQVLGNSDQSLIYIIKLYDEAGNYGIYYYIFDKSLPYMVYQVLPSDGEGALSNIVESLENSTTQTNTSVHWGNYKAIHIANNNDTGLFKGLKDIINQSYQLNNKNFGGIFFKDIDEQNEFGEKETHTYMYVPIDNVEINTNMVINKVPTNVTATTTSPYLANKTTIFVSKTQDENALDNRIIAYNPKLYFSISADDNYYADFFKGDKTYYFLATDAFGNSSSRQLTLNSSVARETFFLNTDITNANPAERRAYNADQLGVYFLDLISEDQAFSAKMTYDYFAINPEYFLSENQDVNHINDTYYYEYGYDTENGDLYKYDFTDNAFKKYDTIKKEFDEENYTFSQLPDSVFFATYPFTASTNNSTIAQNEKIAIGSGDTSSEYFISRKLNLENTSTKQGLYIFRRSYVDLYGNEITQEQIDSGTNENLDILQDDYAVRYHIFYIDRNNIIDLTYKFDGSIDHINSLGDLTEIYLGKDLSGNKEPLITAETINNQISDTILTTNKLKIETNLSIDKYSTIEKLQQYRKYQYDTSNDSQEGKTFNELMEDLSRTINNNIFGYNVSLSITIDGEKYQSVVNNQIEKAAYVQAVQSTLVSNSGNQTKVNYSSNQGANYDLIVEDQSSMLIYVDESNTRKVCDPKLMSFSFKVEHTSPEGTFTTKEDDAFSSVRELVSRNDYINSSGLTNTFISSNADNLSFTFSDTYDKYFASINPYQVTVEKEYNGQKTTILKVEYNASGDGSYVDSFRGQMTNTNARFRDVFEVIGEQAPYKYIINIFDKNRPNELLSNWDEDAIYTVNINYIGDNPSDYTITNDLDRTTHNYYLTSCKIHIDRKAPEYNLKNIATNDPNVDLYTLDKYGIPYSQLSTSTNPEIQAQYKDFLSKYAFPVRLVDNENLLYYYKKLHENYSGEALIDSQIDEVYQNFSTIFNYDNDDSVSIFARHVGDDPTTYRYSILPSEDEYNEGINGHLKFTESSSEFTLLEYSNNNINVSTIQNPKDEPNLYFSNGYYELIEKDEAGNLTRYFVYVADNTNVEVDFDSIMLQTDTITHYTTNGTEILKINNENFNETINLYIQYNNENYYLSTHEDKDRQEWKLYEKGSVSIIDGIECVYLKSADISAEITTQNYYHNGTWTTIPVSVKIGNIEYAIHNNENDLNDNLIGGNQIINQDTPIKDFINMLDLTGIHFVNNNCPSKPSADDKYIFDGYFTVNIYSVMGVSENLIIRKVFDPFTNVTLDGINYPGTIHNQLQSVVKEFSDYAKNNSSVYSYKFEIVNRYGKTPYSIYTNLPDANLELTFENDADGNVLVTIPDAQNYNVKIINFSVFKYQDYEWRPLNQDDTSKLIQTSNTINKDEGLPTTTYKFGEGQYRFYFSDNFLRSDTIYKVVGANVDNSVPEFTFSKPYILEDNIYKTSGNAVLLINDEHWQASVTLKNAVNIDGVYYDLMSSGNSTLLYQQGSIAQLVVNGSRSKIYYSMGRLYSDESCTQALTNINYEIRVSTSSRLIYIIGNNVGARKTYILPSCTPFAGETSNVSEYEIITNWTTDPNNKSTSYIKIDKTLPTLTLMTESGTLEAINGQNYSKEFTITWRSPYKIVSAYIVHSANGKRNQITLNPNGSYDVHELGGYTLYLTDEIGNELSANGQLGFSFNFTSKINEYFSILVNKINIIPSDYITTYTDGKTIRYYYYKDVLGVDEEIVIETDTTKNIAYRQKTIDDEPAFEIYRNNINYTICYVKLIPVVETDNITQFLKSLTVDYTNESGKLSQTFETTSNNTANLMTTYDYTMNQECESFTLSIYKHLYDPNNSIQYLKNIGNKVYVNQYYNGNLVRTYSSDSWATTKGNAFEAGSDYFTITISSTGVHSFEFYDSINNIAINRLNFTLIKDIMFTVNDENAIDNRIYNGNVVVDVPNTQYYGDISVTATLNGKPIEDINGLKAGSKYTFSTSGIYEVIMSAYDTKGATYKSIFNFTIINPNVAKMTFGFGNNYGFTISKVLRNNADITSSITSKSIDSMWLTSGLPDSVGTYSITLLGYDKITNSYTPFTFYVKLNNETPSISAVNYQFGTSTTNSITIEYNPALIYSQVGESYIAIINDSGIIEAQIDITSNSLDALETLTISKNGKFNITIYNKDGQFITNYTVIKNAPLNSSAIFIIITVSIVVVALVITFIILRRHTKFR